MKLLSTFENYFTDIKRYRRFNQQLAGRNTSTAKALQPPIPKVVTLRNLGVGENLMLSDKNPPFEIKSSPVKPQLPLICHIPHSSNFSYIL